VPLVHLLSNPYARAGRGLTSPGQAVGAAIAATGAGYEVCVVHPEDGPASIVDALNRARAEGMTRLVLAGGDGLIHHCLPALAGTEVIVGIVPIGTGNDFARALGLPAKLTPAVAAALSPDVAPIDLIGTHDARWAASVVTGGFSGQVNARANRLRFPRGQQRYTVATLAELRRLHPVNLTLHLDGAVEEYTSSLFAVANTRYFGGGMAICPDASPVDGLLDLTIVGPISAFELARMLPTVFSGRHLRHPAVVTRRAQQVTITTTAPLWADGEPFGPSATLGARAGALRVAGSLYQA
jgi:diacylglycerol kinase (ATP)